MPLAGGYDLTAGASNLHVGDATVSMPTATGWSFSIVVLAAPPSMWTPTFYVTCDAPTG